MKITNGIVVICGGSAVNDIDEAFEKISKKRTYILPILDNGGSSSEIIRFFGGPAVGDLRSRISRIIREKDVVMERFFSFRMLNKSKEASEQWILICEGKSDIWIGIERRTQSILQTYLWYVNVKIRRIEKSDRSKRFNFSYGVVGNFLLTGARLFFKSFDIAIDFLLRVARIDIETQILACINDEKTHHICALLKDDTVIVGQSQISYRAERQHPAIDFVLHDNANVASASRNFSHEDRGTGCDAITFIDTPYIHNSNCQRENHYIYPELEKSNLNIKKMDLYVPLGSKIEKIFYLSSRGNESFPIAHPEASLKIKSCDALIYSIGSIMTSIVPVVILKEIADAIINSSTNINSKLKIFLLNSYHDRETFGMTAVDIVHFITKLIYSSTDTPFDSANTEYNRFVTHLVYTDNSKIFVNRNYFSKKNIVCCCVKHFADTTRFDCDSLYSCLKKIIDNASFS